MKAMAECCGKGCVYDACPPLYNQETCMSTKQTLTTAALAVACATGAPAWCLTEVDAPQAPHLGVAAP